MILKLSVIAYIFTVLIQDGYILSFYGRAIERLPQWLYKPLGGCPRCFGGQVFFWYYIFAFDYKLIDHLFYAAIGILLAMVWHIVFMTLELLTHKLE